MAWMALFSLPLEIQYSSQILSAIVLLPLLACLASGLLGQFLGRSGSAKLCVTFVGISMLLCWLVGWQFFNGQWHGTAVGSWFSWCSYLNMPLSIGYYLDGLTALMLIVVSTVSWLVHIYTIGYMSDEKTGYQRFFSWIALFTFAMDMLVIAPNLIQLFFGWEGVGLVSYLLIGFYYDRPSAIFANLKAFLINRVGDLGMVLAMAALYYHFHHLDYQYLFSAIAHQSGGMIRWFGYGMPLYDFAALALFAGAMAKSAQIPLHWWLPDSMEGPTPISALIHAATMVTAGIFLVARFHVLFSSSSSAMAVMLIIGSLGALFLGMVALVQDDIKRVVAYSTLSQLGYMVAGLGAGAYAVSIYHLMTHAFFKALLFLGSGSVITGMHHLQDMRQMGGLWKKMPVTYACMILASLSLCGIPPFSGFFSKDLIIQAVQRCGTFGHQTAYVMLVAGTMVTALYSIRLIMLTFHGPANSEHAVDAHEVPWSMKMPMLVLLVPSVLLGAFSYHSVLMQANELLSLPAFLPQATTANDFVVEGVHSIVLLLVGIGLLYGIYVFFPTKSRTKLWRHYGAIIERLLLAKYGFDAFNEKILLPSVRFLGMFLGHREEQQLIDGGMVHGSSNLLVCLGEWLRKWQTGWLHHEIWGMFLFFVFLLLGLVRIYV